jgi:small subunit ribosomal protein S17
MENSKKISARKKGTVVSDKGNKTLVVCVSEYKTHKKYKKKIKSTKRYKVHDEENVHKIGDVVEIAPARPVSGGKKYKLI